MLRFKCNKRIIKKGSSTSIAYEIEEQNGRKWVFEPGEVKELLGSGYVTIEGLSLSSANNITTKDITVESVDSIANLGINKNNSVFLDLSSDYLTPDILNIANNSPHLTIKSNEQLAAMIGKASFLGLKRINLSDESIVIRANDGGTTLVSSIRWALPKDCTELFSGINIGKLDLSGLDTDEVENMNLMFCECRARNINFINFNTEKVVSMHATFCKCQAQQLNLGTFNTKSVEDMSRMFSGYVGALDISNFNTSNVVNMKYMFSNCRLKSLDLSNFNIGSVLDMSYMFENSTIDTLKLNNIKLADYVNTTNMFKNSNIKKIEADDPRIIQMAGKK